MKATQNLTKIRGQWLPVLNAAGTPGTKIAALIPFECDECEMKGTLADAAEENQRLCGACYELAVEELEE